MFTVKEFSVKMSEKEEVKNKGKGDLKVYSKNQLWLRICIVIIINLVFVGIWLFTTRKETEFVSHFSFASTVTSIVLSVLAIFMSVTGEAKTQAIRDRIEQEADEIIKVTARLENHMNSLSGKIEVVVHNTDNIKAAINEHPETPQITSGSGQISLINPSENKKE